MTEMQKSLSETPMAVAVLSEYVTEPLAKPTVPSRAAAHTLELERRLSFKIHLH